ncbi:DUF4168 domain-containing protein [Spirochaeta dissipatitropha]
MHTTRKTLFLVFLIIGAILTAALPLSGQEFPMEPAPAMDFEDADIEAFAYALSEIEIIQADMQENFELAITDAGMESERFYELHNHFAQTQGNLPEDLSDAEADQFQETFQALVTIEQEVQVAMIDAVEEEGLDVEIFNMIVAAAQQDPELWEQIQEYQLAWLEAHEQAEAEERGQS